MSEILVIEDSPSIALLLRRRLEMRGFSVRVSVNGHDGLKLIETGKLPDIVLADVMMPGLDGLETIRQVKSKHPGLPVILVTATQLAPEERRKADAVISKPIAFDELFGAIEKLAPNCST